MKIMLGSFTNRVYFWDCGYIVANFLYYEMYLPYFSEHPSFSLYHMLAGDNLMATECVIIH